MSIQEKVALAGFQLTTSKSFDEIRELGTLAAEFSAGVMTKVHEQRVAHDTIEYVVKRMGMMQVMEFSLHYEAGTEAGNHQLSLVPGDYMTSQATFLFIPIGPKESAGYPPLKSFSAFMREQIG
jgi:hypothetical protein